MNAGNESTESELSRLAAAAPLPVIGTLSSAQAGLFSFSERTGRPRNSLLGIDVACSVRTRPMNKRGGPMGPRRGDRKRFPYEARIVSGRLVTPAELQTIHRSILDPAVIEAVSDEVRAVVESVWPDLIAKLPPRTGARSLKT